MSQGPFITDKDVADIMRASPDSPYRPLVEGDPGWTRTVRPLRNLVCVERMPGLGCTLNADGDTVTAGGIILPRAFKRKHPSQKIGAVPDFFRARVVGVGPDVPAGELSPGDEVLVFSFQASEKEGLYTGTDAGAGRLFVDYPDDIVCALEAS